jgi:hypothetical protein
MRGANRHQDQPWIPLALLDPRFVFLSDCTWRDGVVHQDGDVVPDIGGCVLVTG